MLYTIILVNSNYGYYYTYREATATEIKAGKGLTFEQVQERLYK